MKSMIILNKITIIKKEKGLINDETLSAMITIKVY